MNRRFFRKGRPRSHHLHIAAAGSASLADPLDLCDALRADPELRRAYEYLKRSLAQIHKDDWAKYAEKKSAFVTAALAAYREAANL